MDLVQCFVVRTQSRRQQFPPERGVLFPAQAQLVLVPGGDLFDVVWPQRSENGSDIRRHPEQEACGIRVSGCTRPGQNQSLSHQFVREFRRQVTCSRCAQSTCLPASSPTPPFGIEELNVHQQQGSCRSPAARCWIQLAPQCSMLIDNLNPRRELPRVRHLHKRVHAALIQLAYKSQRVSSPPFGWRQTCHVSRRLRSIIGRWHVLRLVGAPSSIVTVGAKKSVSGFACRHARNTVHRVASAACPTHGRGNR
jgi:hypothetical protein